MQARRARNGARWCPTRSSRAATRGGHRSPATPPRGVLVELGAEVAQGGPPVTSRPRRIGLKGRGFNTMPSSAAIAWAAASACCVAMPPCFTGKVVMSPAASTPSNRHLSVRVYRDEAFERLRDAVDPRALQARQGDDPVGGDDPRAREEAPRVRLRWVRARVKVDAALLEQLATASLPPGRTARVAVPRA